jgi:hypothetical protein
MVAQRSTPQVSFTFAQGGRVNQNTKITFTVKSSHLPARYTLVLLRDFGTHHVFQRVERVRTHNGQATAPGVPIGHYRYEIVVKTGKRVITTTAKRSLYSYGNISASELCSRSADTMFEVGCQGGTVQVGASVYPYEVIGNEGNTGPDGRPDVQAQHSSCRSARLTFAVSNGESDLTASGMSLTQTSADEQHATTAAGTVGTATFAIKSAAWDLETWTEPDNEDDYWTGSFNCYTSSGNA